MMIERLLFNTLKDGVAFLKANPDEIVTLFSEEELLSVEEAEKVRDYFLAHPPDVIHGYARKDSTFPCWSITLGGEQESQTFLGDEGGFIDDEADPNHGADQFAAIYSYTFNVMVYANNPDVCVYYYHLMKQVIIAAFPVLKTYDLFDLRFGGADVAPDAAWVPAGLFLRRVTVTCSRQYTQTLLSTKLGRAWRVQSVHLDKAGDLGKDVGDVQTHVTVGSP